MLVEPASALSVNNLLYSYETVIDESTVSSFILRPGTVDYFLPPLFNLIPYRSGCCSAQLSRADLRVY